MRTKNNGQLSAKQGQTQTTRLKPTLLSFIFLFMISAFIMRGQSTTYVPYSGSNTLSCGMNTQLQDHNGNSDYWSYAYGHTVLDAGPLAVIMLNGTYDTEMNYDYMNIYDGAGTGGSLIGSYDGFGTINFTSTPGQIITVELTSDFIFEYPGFDIAVTYSGNCFAMPCSGAQPANTVIATSTLICPGASANLDFATPVNVGNLSVQWRHSMQSAVGPFTNIGSPVPIIGPGSTAFSFTNVNTSYWYSAVLVCGSGGTTNLTPEKVDVQATTINTIPYLEDFEGIAANNDLPNCSWSITDPTRCETAVQTYGYPREPNSGTNYAIFNGNPATGATHYFYTNGLQLTANVTYSASVWYQVPGYNSWGNFAIMIGPNQSPIGLMQVANVPAPNNSAYAVLTNTFMVPTTGVYYAAIRAKGTNSYDYLAWDDLSITMPCEAGNNAPTVNVTGPSVICAGTQISLIATGADTYTWNTGSNNSTAVETPTITGVYSIVGSNSLTGCTATTSIGVTVNQLPIISTFFTGPLTNTICQGETITLFATGALSYTWNQGVVNGPVNTVTPSASTSYSVKGTDALGCIGMGIQQVNVAPLPIISVQSTHTGLMCAGEQATLTGVGATNFMWVANVVLSGNPIVVSPAQSTQYLVTGTDGNGCSAKMNYVLGIADCVGLTNIAASSGQVKVYPNPTSGEFNIELNNSLNKTIQVSDLTGRVVLSQSSSLERTTVKMNTLAAGVYYVKVQTDETTDVIRLIIQ